MTSKHVKRMHTEHFFTKRAVCATKHSKVLELIDFIYKKTNVCEECGLVGQSLHTHEVHLRKTHSDDDTIL